MSVSQNETVAFSALYREITWIFVLYFKHRIADAQRVQSNPTGLTDSAKIVRFARNFKFLLLVKALFLTPRF